MKATVAFIIALHEEGIDYESISRRLKTEKSPLHKDELRWTPLDIHDVGGVLGLYTSYRSIERRRRDNERS